MPRTDMKNLHVPLPELLYQRLCAEAKRAHRPVTVLAREAIDRWLAEKHRASIHEAISAYAREVGGTRDDFDTELEAAGVEHWLATVEDENGVDQT